jgi:hypothetical protein
MLATSAGFAATEGLVTCAGDGEGVAVWALTVMNKAVVIKLSDKRRIMGVFGCGIFIYNLHLSGSTFAIKA